MNHNVLARGCHIHTPILKIWNLTNRVFDLNIYIEKKEGKMLGVMFLVIIGSVAFQTDWMGGDGVLGPVSDWGTQYWVSDSITTGTQGQVSLIATRWNYANWVKHVVENSGALSQGFMPADINGDGIRDLVSPYPDSGVWYENLGDYTFAKRFIGPNDNITYTYPCDLDKDGDIDILTGGAGKVGWYENDALVWTWHEIDSTGTRNRVSPADVDLDGDIDIIGGGSGGNEEFYTYQCAAIQQHGLLSHKVCIRHIGMKDRRKIRNMEVKPRTCLSLQYKRLFSTMLNEGAKVGLGFHELEIY